MTMEPIRLKLSLEEVWAIQHHITEAIKIAGDRYVRLEVVVLAEFYMVWVKRVLLYHGAKKQSAVKVHNIPVSVARILHYRFQHQAYGDINQSVLAKLDKSLTDRNLKPVFPTEIFS